MLQSVVLYTSANLLVKALAILPTPQLVFLRSAVSLVLCVFWLWRKGEPLLGHNRKWLVIRGFTGMVALTLFFHTIRHIPLASATVIQYLSPIFTVLLAIAFDGQRIKPHRWLYFAAAFGGILMVKASTRGSPGSICSWAWAVRSGRPWPTSPRSNAARRTVRWASSPGST